MSHGSALFTNVPFNRDPLRDFQESQGRDTYVFIS